MWRKHEKRESTLTDVRSRPLMQCDDTEENREIEMVLVKT